MLKLPTTKAHVIMDDIILYESGAEHYVQNLKTKQIYDASFLSVYTNTMKRSIVVIPQASFPKMIQDTINRCLSNEKTKLRFDGKDCSGSIDDKLYLLYHYHNDICESVDIYLFSNNWFTMDPIKPTDTCATFQSSLHYVRATLKYYDKTDLSNKCIGGFRLQNGLYIEMPKNTIFKHEIGSSRVFAFPSDLTQHYHHINVEHIYGDSTFLISRTWNPPFQKHNNSIVVNLKKYKVYSMPEYIKTFSHPHVGIFFFENGKETLILDLQNDIKHHESCTYGYKKTDTHYIYEPLLCDASENMINKTHNTYVVPEQSTPIINPSPKQS